MLNPKNIEWPPDTRNISCKINVFMELKKRVVVDLFKESYKFDEWGQTLEAMDSYRKLLLNLRDLKGLSPSVIVVLSNIGYLVQYRLDYLKNPKKKIEIDVADMKCLLSCLIKSLSSTKGKKRIAYTRNIDRILSKRTTHKADPSNEKRDGRTNNSGKRFQRQRDFREGELLPALVGKPGDEILAITISKIGLKDAERYIEPRISVTVADSRGNKLGTTQDTPCSTEREGFHIKFNCTVNIQKPINSFRKGTKIFLEFKHYKPKKKKVSTRCWALLEKDEIKTRKGALELYRKPTHWKGTKYDLFSVKKLYLHIEMKVFVY